MKILLYHEVSFSMTTDQKKLSKGIFCFSFFWWLGVNFRMFATKRNRQFGYFQYLTKEELVTGRVNLGGTALLIMNTIFMIMVEIYFMVSLKRWPSLFHRGQLKSVFVAILSMIVSIIIHTTTIQFPEFNSIRISCASFSFQFLYMVKIHFFVIKQIKNFWNIFVSVVTGKGLPELDDEEQGKANYNSSSFPVNSNGIFVGHKPKPQTITKVGSKIVNRSFSTVHHLIDEEKERESNKCRRIYVISLDKNKSSIGETINEEIIGEDGEISMKAEFPEKEIENTHDELSGVESDDQIIFKSKPDFGKTERKARFILPNKVDKKLSGYKVSNALNSRNEQFFSKIDKTSELKKSSKGKKILTQTNMTNKSTFFNKGKINKDLYAKSLENEKIIIINEKKINFLLLYSNLQHS